MKYKKFTSQDLRRANRTEILRKIYFGEPISRLEISQQINISPATVTNIVSNLLSKNILVEHGFKRSEGGRPSTLLKVNPKYGYFIGIEVGETFIHVELFDILFKKMDKDFQPLSNEHISPKQIVSMMVSGIEKVIQKANLSQKDIIGIGIGFPGLVDPVKGVSVFTPNWGWHNVSITNLLYDRLSIPMYLDNGSKALAVAEMLFGAGKGVSNITVLLVGTGVGSGIITDRKLFRGSTNNAGEFGHTTLNINGPKCRCGSHGCLEAYIGANGIINRYKEIAKDTSPVETGNQITYIQKILDEYEQGNPTAVHTVQETIHYLGVGIANLINVFNPELVLLGGWSGLKLGRKFLPQIVDTVSNYALQQSLAKTTIKLCQLAEGAVAKGAATLVLEHFFETAGESETLMIGGKVPNKRKKIIT